MLCICLQDCVISLMAVYLTVGWYLMAVYLPVGLCNLIAMYLPVGLCNVMSV